MILVYQTVHFVGLFDKKIKDFVGNTTLFLLGLEIVFGNKIMHIIFFYPSSSLFLLKNKK